MLRSHLKVQEQTLGIFFFQNSFNFLAIKVPVLEETAVQSHNRKSQRVPESTEYIIIYTLLDSNSRPTRVIPIYIDC